MADGVVSVARRIEAPADKLFGLLADTGNHPALNGSGMLRQPSPAVALTPRPTTARSRRTGCAR